MKRNIRSCTLGLLLAGFAAACGDNPMPTQELIPPDYVPQFGATTPANGTGACMGEDAYASGNTSGLGSPNALNCTSNDIYLAQATVTEYSTDGGATFQTVAPGQFITCAQGQTFQAKVVAQLGQSANSMRTDIGVWIATDGGNAQVGTCNHYNLVNGTTGVSNTDGDQCGDLDNAASTSVDLGTLTLQCQPNQQGRVEVGSCIGWTQPGGDVVCPVPGAPSTALGFRYGTVPANKSKCNCDPFMLNVIVEQSAKLDIVKACVPTNDGGKFNLQINGTTRGGEKSCGGSTGAITLPAGTNVTPGAQHSFRELAGTGTSLADYTTTYACVNRVGGAARGSGTGAGAHNITLQPNDDVVCTFTNTRLAKLRVKKTSVGVGNPSVTFTPGGWNGNATFALQNGGVFASVGLAAGTYTATETVPSGWKLTNRACYMTSAPGTAKGFTSIANGVSVALGAGEDVTCEFTNTQDATIVINKVTDPANSPGTFNFASPGLTPTTFQLMHAQSRTFSNVVPGAAVNYVITEGALPQYYTFGGVACVVSGGAVTQYLTDNANRRATINPEPGRTVTCTFTNNYAPPTDRHGCSPGFWTNKNGQSYYGILYDGVAPGGVWQPKTHQVKDMFTAATGNVGSATLFDAMNGYKEADRAARNTLAGKQQVLARHAIAAYFNKLQFGDTFLPTFTLGQLRTAVNAMMASNVSQDDVLNLNDVLDASVNGYQIELKLGGNAANLNDYKVKLVAGERVEDAGYEGCFYKGAYTPAP
jgi:hypothetical protein